MAVMPGTTVTPDVRALFLDHGQEIEGGGVEGGVAQGGEGDILAPVQMVDHLVGRFPPGLKQLLIGFLAEEHLFHRKTERENGAAVVRHHLGGDLLGAADALFPGRGHGPDSGFGQDAHRLVGHEFRVAGTHTDQIEVAFPRRGGFDAHLSPVIRVMGLNTRGSPSG
jgi:hypothetical protein